MSKKKHSFDLIIRVIIAIILGVLVGLYLPPIVTQIAYTGASLFSEWLSFVIPLMILAFVTKGIADLDEGAGKLLILTVILAYASTLIGGSASWVMASSIFSNFITPDLAHTIQETSTKGLESLFSIGLEPIIPVTGALVFAFMMGLCISVLRKKESGKVLYGALNDFYDMINLVLNKAIVPFLPLFILGNFANMAYAGSVFAILGIFWRIFLCIIALHLIYVTILFIIAGLYRGQSPWKWIKNQIPGYMTAVGTQSSAATIPTNLECAKNNGTTRQVREFVIPLCSNVHMPGSMITITACSYTVLMMYGMPNHYSLLLRFIMILGIAMVASPGAPGGSIMTALPFLPVIGIDSNGTLASLLISLYIAQDSFGTAANISGDNALALMIDKIYHKHIIKKAPNPEDIV